MEHRRVTVNITNRTIVRTILWVVAAILAYHFIGRVTHILTLIFISIFLALALNPVVSSVSRRLHIKSRIRATAVAYLAVVVILGAFFTFIIPPLVTQTRDFIKKIPSSVETFQRQDSSLARTAKRYNIDEKLSQGARNLTSNYGNFGSAIIDTGKRLAEAIASIFAVLVLTFMMLVEGPRWLEFYWRTLPEKDHARHKKISLRIYRTVSGFANGQVILAAVAGLFAFVTLEIASHIIGVSINPLALAGIVTVFGIIPLFGNPIAALVVIAFCLLNSLSLGLVMAAYFVIYFFIENHTLQPYVQSRLSELTPLTVFVAALLGIGFGGILGAIIAIPAAGTIKILIEDQLEHRSARTT